MTELSGRCHCGAITVTVPDGAFGVVACHCDDCQRMHGNYFAMVAAPAAAVRWTGEDHVRWYDSSPQARRAFCDRCGSRIAKQANGSDRMLVSVGLFGPTTGLRLRKHVWGDHKPDWYDLPPTE
jgi:hypothetical protein